MSNLQPRIEKLEESHAFNERTSEQLSDELRAAYKRIESLERRLEKLDGRLVQLTESFEQGDRTLEEDVPPHSGKR